MGFIFVLAACACSTVAYARVPEVNIAPGVSMPILAFGTSPISYHGCSVQDAVSMYLMLGARHLDLALSYGTEKEVGAAIKASGVRRSDLFLAAKIEGPVGYQKALEQVAEYDLPNTGLDYFDLLLMHYPCSTYSKQCGLSELAERLDTWRGMEHLKALGKTRAIGVSNFDLEQLNQLYDAGYHPSVNQVQWHLGYHNDNLLSGATANGTHIEAWAALGSPVVGGYGMVNPGIGLSDPRLNAVATRYNASTAQVALQWMFKMGVTPVTGTCSESHARGDLGSFNFDLSNSDVAYLSGLSVEQAQALGAVPHDISSGLFNVLMIAAMLALFLVVIMSNSKAMSATSQQPPEVAIGNGYISLA